MHESTIQSLVCEWRCEGRESEILFVCVCAFGGGRVSTKYKGSEKTCEFHGSMRKAGDSSKLNAFSTGMKTFRYE